MKVERMKYHGPGWTIDIPPRHYQMWGPTDRTDLFCEDDQTWLAANPHRTRDHWAASHGNTRDEREGSFTRGPTPQEVIAHFPPSIRKALLLAIQNGEPTSTG